MSRTHLIGVLALIVLLLADHATSAQPAANRTDLAGDPLPPGAIARIGTVRFLPRPYLQRVFFTPDGSTLIGHGGDSVLDFWDASTGKLVGELRDPDLMNISVDQSPDGKLLVLYGHDRRGKPRPDTALRVYDIATRKPLWTKVIDDEYHTYHAVRFSLDGKRIITGSNDLRVWDAKSGEELRRERLRLDYGHFQLSPTGKTFGIRSSRAIHLWDWESPDGPRAVDTGRRYYGGPLAFSADGKTIHVQSMSDVGNPVHAYDVASGKFQGRVDDSAMRWRSPSSDGKVLATAEYDLGKREGSVVIRDRATQKEITRLRSGSMLVSQGCWSKGGNRLAGVTAFRAWVWDVKTGKLLGPDVPAHTATVHSLAFTSDGRLISNSDDLTIRTWDPRTGKELSRFGLVDGAWGLAVSPGGDLLAGSQGPSQVNVWDAKTGKELYKLRWSASRTGGVNKVQFADDEQKLLTFSSDWYARSWDILTGKLKIERRVRPEWLGPEPDEDRAGVDPFYDRVTSAEFAPDGNTVVLAIQKHVVVCGLLTGKELVKFEADPQYLSTFALSADGKKLVTAGAGPPPPKAPAGAPPAPRFTELKVWDLANAKQVCHFRVPGTIFYTGTLAFTPDGKRVVAGSDDEVLRFWDATTGNAVGVIELPRRPTRLAFGGDRLLGVAFQDPTILVYDLATAIKAAKRE